MREGILHTYTYLVNTFVEEGAWKSLNNGYTHEKVPIPYHKAIGDV